MRWHSPKMPKWNSASNSEQLNMRHYMHNNISPLLKLYFHFPLIIWGELIKDMTNWLLLSENFIWLQIWVFILVEFSKCSTKTFSPELLSAFLGAFFSLSRFWFGMVLRVLIFRFIHCHCGLSIWRRCQYNWKSCVWLD